MSDMLWVVEMLHEGLGEYEPTCGVALSRSEARWDLRQWREDNPDDRFRIAKYRREWHDAQTRKGKTG